MQVLITLIFLNAILLILCNLSCIMSIDVVVFPEFDMSRGKKGNSKSAVESEAGNEMFENEAVNDVRQVHVHCCQCL